jgi:2-iminobutanoate/2-iminopropanoate deaminase
MGTADRKDDADTACVYKNVFNMQAVSASSHLSVVLSALKLKYQTMQSILTEQAPKPGGHYSQAIVHGDLIFVAGQLAITATGEKLNGPIEQQTLQALKTTVFISDIDLWGKVNTVYAEFFGNHRPARSIVPVKELHYGFLIEIEAIAVKKQS